MTEIILGGLAVVLFGAVILLLFRSSEAQKRIKLQAEEIDSSGKELKKVQRKIEEFEKKASRNASENEEVKRKSKDLQDKTQKSGDEIKKLKTRIEELQTELEEARGEQGQQVGVRQQMEQQLNGLREQSKRLREENDRLKAAEKQARPPQVLPPPTVMAPVAPAEAKPAGAAEDGPGPRERVALKELQQLRESLDAARSRARVMEQRALRTERDVVRFRNRAEQSHRAYKVTQNLLDLERDKVFLLQTGRHRRPERTDLVDAVEAADIDDQVAILVKERKEQDIRRHRREPRRSGDRRGADRGQAASSSKSETATPGPTSQANEGRGTPSPAASSPENLSARAEVEPPRQILPDSAEPCEKPSEPSSAPLAAADPVQN